jgi:hypothetical protein
MERGVWRGRCALMITDEATPGSGVTYRSLALKSAWRILCPVTTAESVADEKHRKEKPAEVEHHVLAGSNGTAGFLQHRLRLDQVSLADDSSVAADWPNAGLE